jgi:YfiH family protein
LERIETQGLAYYRLPRWKTLRHGIFTRHGGVSDAPFASLNMGGNVGDTPQAVRENHERMFAALRVEDTRVCSVWQVHSADVIIASKPIQGRRWLAQADGMVTDQSDIPLSMRFADCTPLLFHDPVRGVIGIAHAGWRGTIQGVGSQTVRTMQSSFGCRPSDIEAWIGPSIGPDHYQVGEEVVAAVQSWFGSTDHLIRRSAADGTAYLDLWAANALDLQRAGIEHIEIAGLCTATHTRDFFSHRAERGTTGRFGAVICL